MSLLHRTHTNHTTGSQDGQRSDADSATKSQREAGHFVELANLGVKDEPSLCISFTSLVGIELGRSRKWPIFVRVWLQFLAKTNLPSGPRECVQLEMARFKDDNIDGRVWFSRFTGSSNTKALKKCPLVWYLSKTLHTTCKEQNEYQTPPCILDHCLSSHYSHFRGVTSLPLDFI
jgi:hypothetical protein